MNYIKAQEVWIKAYRIKKSKTLVKITRNFIFSESGYTGSSYNAYKKSACPIGKPYLICEIRSSHVVLHDYSFPFFALERVK